jgi:hypothetical protein
LPGAQGRTTIAGRIRPIHKLETVMAKGQMRVPKEKKKPKADKDKPKQLSAYKQSQTGGSASMSAPSGKKG